MALQRCNSHRYVYDILVVLVVVVVVVVVVDILVVVLAIVTGTFMIF